MKDTTVYTIEKLMERITESDKNYDYDKINDAYDLANRAHQGQKRLSGEPYISHPIAVACILIDLGMDTDSLCAALLHDVVEDTEITSDSIRRRFGKDVALLVEGVTKLGKVPLSTKEEQQTENIRKMLLAMSEDIRVIIIKLADRLHNMRTADGWKPDKQREKSLETMEIYAPLAHRLGIRAVKEELEDLALQYLDPVAYREIENHLAMKQEERSAFIGAIKEEISRRLLENDLEPHVYGRVKSTYSIYRKVYVAGKQFDEVYDIYAVRIIVNSVIECYNSLGIIHDLYTPIPNRFKDYISMPKPNMYQSLHTTVIGQAGVPFEVQIRTWDMHYTAEYGIAAHWKYKAGVQKSGKLDERLAWVRQILESQTESADPSDLVSTIKNDLAGESVYVFTPKGDVKCLPVGSNVIDFAYSIHSAVGNRMTSAKVNGRIVPLDYVLKTGEIVDIVTSKQERHGPNREWLKMVKTSEARNKIRSWFKRERREENVKEGKAELDNELRRNMIRLSEEEFQVFVTELAHRQHCDTPDDFYAAIGYGGIVLSRIMPRIRDDYQRRQKNGEYGQRLMQNQLQRSAKSQNGVIVEGIDNCLVRFSQCCNPLPGDDIIGFITRGHGVSVHKKDCINILAVQNEPEQADRLIPVRWAGVSGTDTSFRSTLDIVAHDRNGLVMDISMVLAEFRIPVHELNARELKNGNASIVTTLSVGGVDQLSHIQQRLSKVSGVISVERKMN